MYTKLHTEFKKQTPDILNEKVDQIVVYLSFLILITEPLKFELGQSGWIIVDLKEKEGKKSG